MRIRCATEKDIPALYVLWQDAFGDTKETVDLFFSTCCKAENTLIAEVNGCARAVLYLLENTLQTENGSFRAAYIYAAATDKQYRGLGLMSALLEYAQTLSQSRGWDYLYLVPANDDLFQYYGARGFHTAFYKEIVPLSRKKLERMANKTVTPFKDTPTVRRTSREQALFGVPHIQWTAQVLQFAKALEQAFSVQSAFCENGFAVWEKEESIADVTEFCSTEAWLGSTVRLLLQAETAKQFVLHTPVGLLKTASEKKAVGMLCPVSDRAKRTTIQNAYLGITLG